MKVRHSKRAVADLIGIAGYIREHNRRAAEAVEKTYPSGDPAA